LEQKRQIHEQLQLTIEQTHSEIEQIKTNMNNEKKEMTQCQLDFERSNAILNQHEELLQMLTQRNDDIERVIQQRRQHLNDLENELIKLDNILISSLIHPSYRFRPTAQQYNSFSSSSSTTGTTTDMLMPVRLPFVNSSLWKLCPSGIWV